MRLTVKQKKFCEFYAACGNSTEAAKLAGYSVKTAFSMGSENLRKPDILEYLQSLTEQSEKNRITSAIERQEMLSDIMMGKTTSHHVLPNGEVIQVPVRMADRISAGTLLARMRGELLDKHHLSGKLTVTKKVKRFDGCHMSITLSGLATIMMAG